MIHTGPYGLPDSALEALNPLSQRLVMNRRGTTLWKVRSAHRTYAVKVGYPTTTHAWTALAPAREGAILRRLNRDDVSYGDWEHGTWNVQPWHQGDSLYDLWQPHRAEGASSVPDLGEALSCAEAVASLHSMGWTHGDVQPAHLITSPKGTALIDLALAHGGSVPARYDFSYRGCLVHYESPEISRSVLETGTAAPSMAADVYALGASLFISATGLRHVAYPDDASRKDQRQAIVDGPHRPVKVPGVLGTLINAMLNPDPADRPTSSQVCEELIRADGVRPRDQRMTNSGQERAETAGEHDQPR
ncbi:protein kinase [Streptomyces sp. LX-29]|uniref:protein kinase domain-containing protein n=1 Tax=Streptomyces sp. LX-29 TaxID=2900152 RepID=UPI00240DF9A7|nr:protein kinase [Streptomyces sp. LX-29]WFB10385.1 protein kinase [Streptomyces sp. LX-29]